MTEKCEFPTSPRSRNYEGLSNLTAEVKKLTGGILGKQGLTQVAIKNHWNDILGSELAYGIKPITLVFPHQERMGGTLKVRTAGGAFALLFEHQKSLVIEKINTYFGYPAVNTIKIEQGGIKLADIPQKAKEWPLDEDQIQILSKKIANIQDDNLRKQMMDIGIQLLQKANKT